MNKIHFRPSSLRNSSEEQMMRVALFCPQFPEYSLAYANALSSFCDVRVVLDAQQVSDEFAGRKIRSIGDSTTRHLDFKKKLDCICALFWLIRFRPHILHIQEPAGIKKLRLCLYTSRFFKLFCKVVVTIHDPLPHEGADAVVAIESVRVRARLRETAVAVVVHGQYCKKAYSKQQTRTSQHIIVSNHGLILCPESPNPMPRSSPAQLLFFGRMQAYKGLDILLEASQILRQSGVAFKLTIAGQGEELDRLGSAFEGQADTSVENRYIAPNEVIRLINASTCVVLPYTSATQSGVLAAAFAGSRFVIASRVGGLPDVVQDMQNGLLVAPGDAFALAEAIKRVVTDSGLQVSLCLGAKHTANNTMNWTNIAKSLFDEFTRMQAFGVVTTLGPESMALKSDKDGISRRL